MIILHTKNKGIKMKKTLYGVAIFIVIILITLTFITKDYNKMPVVSISNLAISEISTCTELKKCISQIKIADNKKDKTSLLKVIKDFLRKKIY
ncbi:MAG TPA: hypothetical protein DHV44_06690 [Providencia sp.]|nr:hypothetical protein CEQ08_18765 [Providencia rettgeri]RXN73173.1 hypothetical protein D0Z62_04955 [Providencia rettgeri]HCI95955.1 hypothetical protein [Providencia sp.]